MRKREYNLQKAQRHEGVWKLNMRSIRVPEDENRAIFTCEASLKARFALISSKNSSGRFGEFLNLRMI